MPTNRPLVIGVAGGSGSGKTTVISHLRQRFGEQHLCLMEHDSYYRDLSHLDFNQRAAHNFDHPASLETELMIRHVKALMEGYNVDVPMYDFKNHVRKAETAKMFPRSIIIVDGILIFSEPELRALMDIKIFVDTDDDIRLLRRLRRDIMERGRSIDNVLHQYETFVRPMHLEFVEPSKRYADIIIPHGGENKVALDLLIAMIQSKLPVE